MVDFNCLPIEEDLPPFPRGDFRAFPYFAKGVCWTPTRPQVGGVDVDDETLGVPWEEHYWWSEIRASYVSAIRYFNGWVPWYGMWPNYTWWDQYSLQAVMQCGAEWNQELGGTVVTVTIRSVDSLRIRPSKGYHWSVRSGEPVRNPDAEDPTAVTGFHNFVTWKKGRATITNSYTLRTPYTPPEAP